jgi:Trypsin-like peptidase domain
VLWNDHGFRSQYSRWLPFAGLVGGMTGAYDSPVGRQLLVALRPIADRLVRPSLVPIYIERSGKQLEQFGTGFLVNYRDRPLLITAAHCLFNDSSVFEKHIFFEGRLRLLNELHTGEVISDPTNDLAVLYADELGLDRCLPMSCLVSGETTCGLISIIGFLGRDFKRELSKGSISPAPWLFHYKRAPKRPGKGYVGILYHKSRNRDATSGELVQSPIPRGISGGPMLDTMKLREGKVAIVGVFTTYEQDRGLAYGETAQKVIDLLGSYERGSFNTRPSDASTHT